MTVPSGGPAPAGQPARFATTPHAERFLLDSDALRRRQLRSALLHGSSRLWRERRRVWPSVVSGLIVVAVIVAAIAVYGAFQRQQRIADEQRSRTSAGPALVAVTDGDR
jgi:hypothetical protein